MSSDVPLTDPGSTVTEKGRVASGALDVSCTLVKVAFDPYWQILRVSVSGHYGKDVDNCCDILHLAGMMSSAVSMLQPKGLIVDMHRLACSGSDMLIKLLVPPTSILQHERSPFAVVTGPQCDAVIRSLLANPRFSAEELDRVFVSEDEAILYVTRILEVSYSREVVRLVSERADADREFWEHLGCDLGPGRCRQPGCNRLQISNSVLCRKHHFERYRRSPCPFD